MAATTARQKAGWGTANTVAILFIKGFGTAAPGTDIRR